MADGLQRYQHPGAGPGQYYSNQHTYQYQQRHGVRNGSPVNSGRGTYTNDTPSPSRSPVSQASSHHQYSMYNQGQQSGQHVMMNGGHQQRYMQPVIGNKYQHQSYQQPHGQQQHHHPPNQTGGHGLGHQHTFSSGNLSNATPHPTYTNLHNNHNSNGHGGLNENFAQNPQWQRQLQLSAESRQARTLPNHHAKKDGAVSLKSKIIDQFAAEETAEDSEDERSRTVKNGQIGPRQYWTEADLSGQGLRALSPKLFDWGFLTSLHLDGNQLRYLDPRIGHLRRLTHLDISNNEMTELPEEIGMLVNLKELLAFDNELHTLPNEIGNLFKLETLGIDGNPLDPEYKERIMRDGTKSLITYIRETADPGPAPSERSWVTFDNGPTTEELSVMSYNILCDKYATTSQYGYTAAKDLAWDYRKARILEEIRSHDAEIVCLQEIDRESYDDFFRRELSANDYRGIFWPKSRAKTMAEKDAKLVDGCATFYKDSKYILLEKALVDFANIAINRLDMKGEHDTFNRVMPRDHIAVLTFLENRMTGSRLIVGNAHLLWDPEYADVKLVQVAILMEQITKSAEKWSKYPACTDKAAFRHNGFDGDSDIDDANEAHIEPGPSLDYTNGPQIPLIICGDFNCAEDSGVYELITKGGVPGNHADMGNRGYGSLTRDGMAHPFKLESAYKTPEQISFTNYTPNFTGVLDYIWYSTNSLQVEGLLGNIDDDYLRKVPGFPNHFFPSDHLSLKADFSVKQRKESKTIEASNGMHRDWERSS